MVLAFAFGFFKQTLIIFLKCKYHSIIAILLLLLLSYFILLFISYFVRLLLHFFLILFVVHSYIYIYCLDGYYTWTALVLLVVSMFSHDFFIISDIVNVREKQKYISVAVVVRSAAMTEKVEVPDAMKKEVGLSFYYDIVQKVQDTIYHPY